MTPHTIPISEAIRAVEKKSVDADWDGRYKEADYCRAEANNLKRDAENGELHYVLF